MLSLTENAKAAITGITSQSGLPESGGVRISLAPDADQVEMSLTPQPESGDDVIEEDGVRVFVEEAASPLLAEHTLDAENGPEGVGFALRKAS
jgi:iron-sulfur cluster assembly protein